MGVANYIDTDQGFSCPACGEEECSLILIKDEDYDTRNGIPGYCKVEISEDGEFEMVACGECGYKWIENNGVATTSQVKSLVLSYFIQSVRDCGIEKLEEYIGDLDFLNGIPKDEQDSLLLYENTDSLEVCKLAFLAIMSDFLDKCDVDALMDVYNGIFGSTKVTDLVETGEGVMERIQQGANIYPDEVHVDD